MSVETNDMLRAILEAVHVNSAKIDGLADRMDRVEGRLSGVEGKVEGLETRLEKLETGQAMLQQDLESFRNETAMNFRKLDRHMRLIEADLDLTMEKMHVFEASTK